MMKTETRCGWRAAKRLAVMLTGALILCVACGRSEQVSGGNATGTGSRVEAVETANRAARAAQPDTARGNLPPAGKTAVNESTKPAIEITLVPQRGAGSDRLERIGGAVGGVDVKKCKVVIFARTDVWYVQPYVTDSDTPIGADGRWENDTHLGREYAALLVKSDYKPPSMTGMLPPVRGEVLAVAQVQGK